MGLWKRGKWYWIDAWVHGHRFREPLGTTDWREAKRLERERIEQLQNKASVPSASSLTYAAMDVSTAIAAYAEERRAQVLARMVAYWLENARPLEDFFKDTKLRQISPAQLAAYQNARTDAGRAPKTINGELSVLRQVLKRARLWYRFEDDYTTLRNRKPPVGRALGPINRQDQQRRLFQRRKPFDPSALAPEHFRSGRCSRMAPAPRASRSRGAVDGGPEFLRTVSSSSARSRAGMDAEGFAPRRQALEQDGDGGDR